MLHIIGGYKRHVANLKMAGAVKIREGKAAILSKDYIFISKASFQESNQFLPAIYSHCFIILCWNLMQRSVSIADLMYCHFSWANDSIIVTIPKHKGDQVYSIFGCN